MNKERLTLALLNILFGILNLWYYNDVSHQTFNLIVGVLNLSLGICLLGKVKQ